jgi:hypothetical protein
VASNKRYAGNSGWTVSEVAEKVAKDIGKVDILVRGWVVGKLRPDFAALR